MEQDWIKAGVGSARGRALCAQTDWLSGKKKKKKSKQDEAEWEKLKVKKEVARELLFFPP